MAQLVEHILGKDEVPGSNPGISLKRRRLGIPRAPFLILVNSCPISGNVL